MNEKLSQEEIELVEYYDQLPEGGTERQDWRDNLPEELRANEEFAAELARIDSGRKAHCLS